ncbi:MAG TPA: phenylalanine--tRNA ligase subunit beta [Tepidisphaeraceae bacterium]|nr:phenylalanine--tRNA ligase subunit beta [Tepidisphaeraceae bacterium]
MKVSLEWLKDFVSPLPPANRAGEILTMGGLPVEHIEQVGPDTVLDVEVTSNRSDCLSVQGVARELAALGNLKFEPAPVASIHPTTFSPEIQVEIKDKDLCPHYTARLIQGVKVAPSPEWLQRRLIALGQRPINNIVDITNYVLFELGQPLHAFDLNEIRGKKIVVRRAAAQEKMTTLDGVERTLDNSMLVIADTERALVVAGVMGGESSGVTDSTTDILLESARFDPMATRRTSRALQLASDSSYRFERGLDPTLAKRASDRAAQLMVEIAGGKLVSAIVEDGSEGYSPTQLTLRLSSLERLLGVKWPIEKCVDALARLGFNPKSSKDSIDVTVPSHRLDVRIEADLIEEVARVIGYEHIPTTQTVQVILQPRDERLASIDLIRKTLQASGYFEAMTFSFVSDQLANDFTPADAVLHQVDPRSRRADNRLRPSVLPGLLESIRLNENNGTSAAKLYEIASTFWIDSSGKSRERRALGLAGDKGFASMRGAIELLMRTLDAQRAVTIKPTSRAGFGSGACGEIFWGESSIGFIGTTSRSIAEKLGLRGLPAIAELFVDDLVAGTQHVPQLRPLPKFPAIRRDLSLLLTEQTRFEQIQSLVHELKLAHLESLEHVTTYRGKPLERGQKSVTIQLCFRSPSGTLTSESVDASVTQVIDAAKKLGAMIRS